MIFLLSVGVSSSSYQDPNITHTDARKIFLAFQKVFSASFDDAASYCLFDCSVDELRNSFKLISNLSSRDDVIFFYFSGHGYVLDEMLLIGCSDSIAESPTTWLPLSQLTDFIRIKSRKAVFILDCCHAGAGFSETQKKSHGSPGDIFIVASSQYFERQIADSCFSDMFCQTLYSLHGYKRIYFSTLINALEIKSYASLSEGSYDLLLYDPSNDVQIEFSGDFTDRFKKHYLSHPPGWRELLLYSLASLDHNTIIQVLTKLYEAENADALEPCWLVRRAIGSLLAQNSHSSAGATLIKKLSTSFQWMHKSISLIANRNNRSDVQARVLQDILFTDAPMSLKWLASLYLSEYEFKYITKSLESQNFFSLWGVIDVFERYSAHNNFNDVANLIKNKLIEHSLNAILGKFLLHCSLKGCDIEIEKSPLHSNLLVETCYKAPTRQHSYSVEQKWLLSNLYGKWRGLSVVDLSGYFLSTNTKKIKNEILEFSEVPSVEVKIALLAFLCSNIEHIKRYYSSLEWVYAEENPWLRKYATNICTVLGSNPQDRLPLSPYFIDRKSTVGFYDFLLRVAVYYPHQELIKFIDKHDLPLGEYSALIRDIDIIKRCYNYNFEK